VLFVPLWRWPSNPQLALRHKKHRGRTTVRDAFAIAAEIVF
jgi:hypothetical protein